MNKNTYEFKPVDSTELKTIENSSEAYILNKTKTRSKWVVPLISSTLVLIGVGAVGGGLVAYKAWQIKKMGEEGAPPEMPTFVKLAEARPVSFRQNSSAVGTLIAPQWITLSNEVAGTVTHVNLSAGAVVKKGDVLLQLDTSIEVAQLQSAKAASKMAKSRFDRTQDAFKRAALTALELDEADSDRAQAEAKVIELEAIINKKTLTAPFDARIGLSDTHLGQYIPSGTKIATLQGTENYLFVDFTLPQSVAHVVDVGQQVTLHSGPTTLTATITAMDSQTDKVTRNRMARAKIESTPPFMKPGDSVKVLIEYGPEVHAVAVPAESLRRTPTGSQVFVAEKDKEGALRAKQRTVQVIQTIGNDVALFSGVQIGESVVGSGSFKLMSGGLLQVASEAQAGEVQTDEVQTVTSTKS